MADEDWGGEIPQHVRIAVRAEPRSPVALPLPEELRQRMQAAVKAELARGAGERERPAWDGTAGSAAGHVPGRPGSAGGLQPVLEAEPTGQAPAAAGAGRHIRRGLAKPRRRARTIALGLAVMVVLGSLAAVAAVHSSPSPAAVRAQAAAWIAEQFSPEVTVSCDAAMCAALRAHGFPASKLVVLGPASPDPVPSAVVVDTATVRELFGTSLAAGWAPAVLASFGSGSGTITVRVVAPHGAAAYQAALRAEMAIGKTSGANLLHDPNVAASATARSQLLAGQVDMRLLQALVSVAAQEPINIVRFGNLGAGASPGVPFGFADLAETIPAAHMDTAAYVRAVWAVLDGPDAQIRPARAISGLVLGQPILRVEFAAPSPLSNPGPGTP